jgi:nucleoside-diphosphate kinase
MSKHIERTLVLLKPDTVERGLIGRVIGRLEDAGFKIVAMKMVQADAKLASEHYDEDVAKRNGEHIRRYNIDFLTSGPVVAIVIEGLRAVENIRKFCGTTEPMSSPPGTIRGDFSHSNYASADDGKKVLHNIIHASGDLEYAEKEIKLWFNPEELIDYTTVHEKHTR